MERKNVNRGFKKLRVWNDVVQLYVLAWRILSSFSFELKKVASNAINAIDSCHSINRNIAEGYCRRSIKECLNYLNIALGSCGEFHSSYVSFRTAEQISEADYEQFKELNYRVEPESGVKTVKFSAKQFVSQHIDALQKQMQQIDPAEVSERYFEIFGAEAHWN